MKSLLVVFILSTFAFSYTVEFNKNFSKEISNDEITSYITIYSKKKTQNRAINELSKYKRFMEKYKEIKKTNIRQNTYPEYRYEKFSNKRILDGYKATLNYTVSSKDAVKVSEYLEKLLVLKKDQEETYVSFSNLSYKVSKEIKQVIEDELRLEAIMWANSYTKELSKNLTTKCEIEKIVIGGNSFIRPVNRSYATMAKSSTMEMAADISLPKPADTNISINSSFQFRCK